MSEKNGKIPYTAVGNEELSSETRKRVDELWDKKDEESGIKLLSLLLSRGKTEGGKALHCDRNCDTLYLVFPYDKPHDCECGGIIKYE